MEAIIVGAVCGMHGAAVVLAFSVNNYLRVYWQGRTLTRRFLSWKTAYNIIIMLSFI